VFGGPPNTAGQQPALPLPTKSFRPSRIHAGNIQRQDAPACRREDFQTHSVGWKLILLTGYGLSVSASKSIKVPPRMTEDCITE
jgi:hypothetical protein